MNVAAIVFGLCLTGQAAQEPSRYEPRVEQRAAPATKAEDEVPDASVTPASDLPLDVPHEESPDHRRAPRDRHDETDRAETPLADVPRHRLRPPDILAQALIAPREGALSGKPLSLLAALSRTTDRQHQLRIARAYWRLATAQAEYHWAIDHCEKLSHYGQAHSAQPELLSAEAAARAELCDVELTVGDAQQELADLIAVVGTEELPLASDRPHVGGYSMYYEEIFSRRPPPPRIRLIHRMLPIRRTAIDAHGEAILAAADALEASAEELQKSGQGLWNILTALDQLKRQRRLFLAEVRDYNWDIAEYLLNIAPLGTSDKTLVSKLILDTERSEPALTPSPPSEHTLAPAEPTGAQPSSAPNEPTPAQRRTANYQSDETRHENDAGLYSGLMELDSRQRVEKLAGLMHWRRALPDEAGRPAALNECLRVATPAARFTLLAAYWRTGESEARYQVMIEQADQLSAMPAVVVGARAAPGIAEAGVRLQAARRAAQADAVDAQAALVESQFALTLAVGASLDGPWLLTATTPPVRPAISGAQNTAGATARTARLIAARQTSLRELADAVIQADVSRASLHGDAHRSSTALGEQPQLLDHVVHAVTDQTERSLEFLSALRQYNVAAAEHALATLPANVSSDELARQLAPDPAAATKP